MMRFSVYVFYAAGVKYGLCVRLFGRSVQFGSHYNHHIAMTTNWLDQEQRFRINLAAINAEFCLKSIVAARAAAARAI